MGRFILRVETTSRDKWVVDDESVTNEAEARAMFDEGGAEYLRGGDVIAEEVIEVWEEVAE